MKTSSKHLLAVAAIAGLVTGCATKPTPGTCAGKPGANCSAKSGCSAKGNCSGKGSCGASCPAPKKSN